MLETKRTPDILIVGAGPTGLVLALRLHRHGVRCRVIDQRAGPGEASRALVVHARTLEFYRQLGLADRFIEAGTLVETVRLRERGEQVGAFSLRDMGDGLSPYPFALCLPQDEHESLLVDTLAEQGLNVEWSTRLDRLEQNADGVQVTLSHGGKLEQARFVYVAGCDGARSQVRASIDAEFEGGTYDRLYYVADVKPRHPIGPDLVVALDKHDFGLMLPARKGQNQRLIGFVPADREHDPSFEDVRESAERLLGIEVGEVNWFSTYRVHHRVASRFRVGRCFLLGDAGHVHSPVGGQGMNTGIGDALNLSWKLASVVTGHASTELLDTYELERIAFARSLVATTDRAFQVITDEGMLGTVFRRWVMPKVMPAAASFAAGRHAIFRLVSQVRIAYPTSPLSEGRAGDVDGGDRLPWVPGVDNFAPLASLDWQAHVYGTPAPVFAQFCRQIGLPLHSFDWTEFMGSAGFARDAAYLVRPDGYVALAAPDQDCGRFDAFITRKNLHLGSDQAVAAHAGPAIIH